MSLRTKLLAAVIGLYGAILLLALYTLVRGDDGGGDTRRDLARMAGDLLPPAGPEARARARETLHELRRSGRAGEVFLVEEMGGEAGPGSERHRVTRVEDAIEGVASPTELQDTPQGRRVVEEFREARRGGDSAWLATVVPVPPQAPREAPRVGLVSGTPAAHRGRSGAKAAYLVLLGGVVVLSTAAFFLVSRLVTRRLARLTAAADRIAAGNYDVALEPGDSNDEIDRTILAFQRMAREIGEYQGQLEDRVLTALARIRKAEQHLAIAQRLAATGKLASGVAHEINNPLGGMKNAVRALARGDLPAAKQAEYLALVADGLARVEETVKKFLSFMPRRVEPRPTDLADVARKALALARHRIERKGIRVEETLAPDGGAVVFGDPHELQQVALNLLLNAADAIPEGRPGALRVRAQARGEEVVLEVTDDGVGMTPEEQAHCFDLFFTTKEVGEGSGLGLAVVHNVVTNHGGRIEVESTRGQGSTFRVLLPREGGPEASPAPADAPAASDAPAAPPPPPGRDPGARPVTRR